MYNPSCIKTLDAFAAILIASLIASHFSFAEIKSLNNNLYALDDRAEATFYLLIPPHYDAETEYPLIISLHGAGEKGDRMMRYWKEAAAKRGMILLCPNSRVYGWDQESVMDILHEIDAVIREYSVDQDKALLSGISAGGTITYALGLTGKGMFPYLNPMSTALREEYLAHVDDSEKPKLYITHGARDEMISPEQGGEKAAKQLSERGFDVTFVLRLDDGHEVPEGEQERILEWFVPSQTGSEKTKKNQ